MDKLSKTSGKIPMNANSPIRKRVCVGRMDELFHKENACGKMLSVPLEKQPPISVEKIPYDRSFPQNALLKNVENFRDKRH